MNKTGRLIIAIVSAVIILILMGFGIYATFADIGIGGDIHINAKDLQVTIAGRIYGHNRNFMTADTAEELEGATWTSTTDPDGLENNVNWDDLDLSFVSKTVDIVIEVDITNNHPEKAILVDYKDLSPTTNKNFTVAITSSSGENVVPVGEKVTFSIVLKLIDESEEASGSLSVLFSLKCEDTEIYM